MYCCVFNLYKVYIYLKSSPFMFPTSGIRVKLANMMAQQQILKLKATNYENWSI